MNEKVLLDDITRGAMRQKHLQHFMAVVGNSIGNRGSRHPQRHTALEPGRFASTDRRLEMMCDRVANTARDVSPRAAVEEHLDNGGVSQLAREVERRCADAGVEIKTTASDEHRRHLRLVADDDTLKNVPAAVVEHFEDVVSARTPTQQCLTRATTYRDFFDPYMVFINTSLHPTRGMTVR